MAFKCNSTEIMKSNRIIIISSVTEISLTKCKKTLFFFLITKKAFNGIVLRYVNIRDKYDCNTTTKKKKIVL